VREKPLQFMQSFQPAASGHIQIQYNHIPPQFLRLLKQFRDIRGLADYGTGKLIGEDLAQAPAKVRMVVCE
jgi:hypothetical protein